MQDAVLNTLLNILKGVKTKAFVCRSRGCLRVLWEGVASLGHLRAVFARSIAGARVADKLQKVGFNLGAHFWHLSAALWGVWEGVWQSVASEGGICQVHVWREGGRQMADSGFEFWP